MNGGKFTTGQTLSVVLKFNNPTKSSFTFGIQVTANVDKISAVIGSEGAEIVHPIGVGISVMPGTFLVPTMVSIEPSSLQSSSITNFPKEFILFGGVKISYTGEAELPIDMFVPAQNNPNAKSFFAARMIEQTSTKRLSVVDTAKINGSRLITNSPPFPGITEPGNYVFLGAPEGTSMAMFRVFQDNGEAARGATVDLAGNSSAFLGIASSDGFAAIPVNTQSSEIGVVAIGTDLNGTVLGNITNIPTNHLPPMPLPEDLPTLISHITDLFVAGLGFNTEDLPFAGPPSQCNLSPITVEPTEYPNIPGFLFSTGESFQIKVNCFLEIGQIDCTSSPEFSDIAELPITGYELIFTSYLPSAIPPSSPPPPITVGRNPGDSSKGFVTASLAGYGMVEVKTQKYCLRKMTSSSGIPVPIMQLSLPQGALVKPIAVSPTLKILTTGNGTGTVSGPLGIQCVNNCTYTIDYGETITLTAEPDTGFSFLGWGQDCSAGGTNRNIQVTLSGDKTCTAIFSSGPTTLHAVLNVDNNFDPYISTDDSVRGKYIGSQRYTWQYGASLSTVLTPGVVNYIHVIAYNSDGPGGFVGEFTLSNNNFMFANGTQIQDTNPNDWLISTSGFGSTTTTPTDEGALGCCVWQGIFQTYTNTPIGCGHTTVTITLAIIMVKQFISAQKSCQDKIK